MPRQLLSILNNHWCITQRNSKPWSVLQMPNTTLVSLKMPLLITRELFKSKMTFQKYSTTWQMLNTCWTK
jgi:hypothetical protein